MKTKQSDASTGLTNMSVNSSRRSGAQKDRAGHSGSQRGTGASEASAKVPDQQAPADDMGQPAGSGRDAGR